MASNTSPWNMRALLVACLFPETIANNGTASASASRFASMHKGWDIVFTRNYARHIWPSAEAVVQVVFRSLALLLNLAPLILYLIVKKTLWEWPKVTMASVCSSPYPSSFPLFFPPPSNHLTPH